MVRPVLAPWLVFAGLLTTSCVFDDIGTGEEPTTSGSTTQDASSSTSTQPTGAGGMGGDATSSTGGAGGSSTTSSVGGGGGNCDVVAEFTGLGQALRVDDTQLFDQVADFAIGAWVKPHPPMGAGTRVDIASRFNGVNSEGFRLSLLESGGNLRPQFFVWIQTPMPSSCVVDGSAFPSESEVHVLAGFKTTGSMQLTMYQDGALTGMADCQDDFVVNGLINNPFLVGMAGNGQSAFGGAIDDLVYLNFPPAGPFDAATIGSSCDANVLAFYDFENVVSGAQSVDPTCGSKAAPLTVGLTPSPEGTDPTFGCL